MTRAIPFALGALCGALLALLLTSNATSRQASTSRPAVVTPLAIGTGAMGTPTAGRAADPPAPQSHPAVAASPTPRPPAEPAPLESDLRAGGRPAPSTPGATPKPTRKPRPQSPVRPVDGLRGVATWYPAGGPVAAAGPALRAALGRDWRGSRVRVCSGGRCVTIELIDFCACGPRHGQPTLLDLGLDAFTRLADPSAGVIDVTIR